VLVLNALADLIESMRVLREERKAVIAISDGWSLYGPDRELTKPLLAPTLDSKEPANVHIPIPGVGRDPITGRPTTRPPSESFSNDGAGPVDRASCEVDRYALAELSNEQRFTGLMQAANRSNVSFYPVGPGSFSASYALESRRNQSLQLMADMTDGYAIRLPGSMEAGFRRVIEDLSSYYLAGYYSDGRSDGRFHRIEVRIKRPGIQVRARAGYLAATAAEAAAAVSPRAPSPDAAEAQIVSRALSSLAALNRERPLRVQAAVSWTQGDAPLVRAVAETSRAAVRGDDWGKGARLEATLLDGSGAQLASSQSSLAPGTYAVEMTLTPRAALAPGDYTLRVRARGTEVVSPGIEELRLTVPAAPRGSGAVFRRRGPGTGISEMATADARFRRTERMIVEVPASTPGTLTARVLDRTGKPLSIPVSAATREDAGGLRWHRIDVLMAPLAQGDYILEASVDSARTLVGFRVVP
jgi:hypothetical protein